MKKILIFLISLFYIQSAITQNRLLTVTIDPSRAWENSENFDSGLDIVATLVIDRSAFIEPLVKFESFTNIKFYKFAIGGNYVIPINEWSGDLLLELAPGFEIGLIIRQRPNLKSWEQYISPALNFETRLFLLEEYPIIFSYNGQYRTDFEIYNMNAKFIHSMYVGLGYIF